MRSVLQLAAIATLAALMLFTPRPQFDSVLAASAPSVSLNVDDSAPRKVEETTQMAVRRDYAAAWQAMAEALDQNRTGLLDANFVGTANEKLSATVQQQRKSGLHQRLRDEGHNVEAVFYSAEGSAMELHDTVHLEIQLLDGNRVVHSEHVTLHYLALLTAAENSWKVRVLEAVPSF